MQPTIGDGSSDVPKAAELLDRLRYQCPLRLSVALLPGQPAVCGRTRRGHQRRMQQRAHLASVTGALPACAIALISFARIGAVRAPPLGHEQR